MTYFRVNIGDGRGRFISQRNGRAHLRAPAPMPDAARSPFRVSRATDGDVFRLALHGELDVATHEVLKLALRDAERGPQDKVIVDLGQLSFVDAGGANLLLDASQRALADGRGFGLVNPRPSTLRLLELLKATHLVQSASN